MAFYQDLENMVPIRVEATIDGGAVKRTLVSDMTDNIKPAMYLGNPWPYKCRDRHCTISFLKILKVCR